MANGDYDFEQKSDTLKYYCKQCDHYSYRKYNFERHLLSAKHKRFKTDYKIEHIEVNGVSKKIIIKSEKFECKCGKKYNHQTNLIRHKKTNCKLKENSETIEKNQIVNFIENNETNQIIEKKDTNDITYKEIIMTLINENKEMRKTISELVPKVGNTTNNTTNITNNANFNLNIFLNEQCKDALNIDDFIKNIEVSLSDLLLTKDKGLIEGISNIFIENMNKLSLYERPLHCTDLKRETLYIKQDEWKKDKDNTIVKNAIKRVSQIQTKNVNKWSEQNPEFLKKPEKQDEFIKLVKNVSDDIDDKQDKIIKKLCKNVYINNKIINEIENENE